MLPNICFRREPQGSKAWRAYSRRQKYRTLQYSHLRHVPQQWLIVVLAKDLYPPFRFLEQRLPRLGRYAEYVTLADALQVVALRQQ